MIKVEITNKPIETKSGIVSKGPRAGQPFSIRSQIAYLHRDGDPYPEKFKVQLDDDTQPYAPGFYTISPNSFYVGDFDRLTVSPKLVPLAK